MKQLLDNHPAILLIGACAACITATASVLLYFHGEAKFVYENKIESLMIIHEEAKLAYENKIESLKTDISSIDRGIPIHDKDESSFNVASSVIGEDKMLRLSNAFEDLVPNLISLNPPNLESWTFTKLNELSIHALAFDDKCKDEILSKLQESELPPDIKPVFVWHKREISSAYIRFPDSSPENMMQIIGQSCDHLRLFPSISVYQIDSDWIKRNVSFFSVQIPPEKLSDEIIETLVDDPASIVRNPDAKIRYIERDSSFFAEFTGPFLFNKIYENLTLSTMFPEVDAKLMSIEKAKSTLYFHNRFRFSGSLDANKLEANTPITVDDEYFVISVGESAIVVNISLPTFGDYHDNYVWSQRWLSGLRVQSPHL